MPYQFHYPESDKVQLDIHHPAQCNKIQLSLLLLMTADMQQNATTFDNCCILLHSAWLGLNVDYCNQSSATCTNAVDSI